MTGLQAILPHPAFIMVPGPTEILIIIFVMMFFILPWVLGILIVMLRGREEEDDSDILDYKELRRNRKRPERSYTPRSKPLPRSRR